MKTSEAIRSVIGIDLGDRYSYLHELDMQTGETLSQTRLPTNPKTFGEHFTSIPSARITLEVGAHSPWSSRLLQALGHQVIVANPRTLALIHSSNRKRDELDAEKLARLARLDPELLSPIRHRSLQAHADRTRLKVREALVRSRTSLIIHTRNMLKAFGIQLPKCATTCFHKRVLEHLPEQLEPAVAPLLESLKVISRQIYEMEKDIEKLSRERYPETIRLRQVVGVGPLLSLAFVLTLDDPSQFTKSRDVGAYLGLVPKQRQSGERDPALGISKVTGCSGRCSYKPCSISLCVMDRTATSSASDSSSSKKEVLKVETAPSSLSLGNSPFCFIGCGLRVKSTTRSTTATAT